jgi:biotin operon repressor
VKKETKYICFACSNSLTKDVIAINKKLFSAKTKFMCLHCIATHLDCSIQDILDKIEQFKDEGCKLFK